MNRIAFWAVICVHLLGGCVVKDQYRTTKTKVGPQFSTVHEQELVSQKMAPILTRVDVIIPVFDPGLSEKAEDYEEQGVWPELRRAEANRFAYKLKQALDNNRALGAVRVTPDATASGDLYVLGEIKASDGLEVKFALTVVDIRGHQWLRQTFAHKVAKSFYKQQKNNGKDAYEPIFEAAAAAIIDLLDDRSHAELEQLKTIAALRFGASLNAPAFTEYMDIKGNRVKLVSKPSDNDPMLQRVAAVRVREQLFIDNLQQNYTVFSQQMEDSYLQWQAASFTENDLHKTARSKSLWKAAGGALLVGLSVAAAISASKAGSTAAETTLSSAAAVGGLAGAWMLSSSFQSREEAALHKDAIDELGESIDMELAPQVVSFQDQSIELTGNIQEQFAQWRAFLKRIYEQEMTPDTAL